MKNKHYQTVIFNSANTDIKGNSQEKKRFNSMPFQTPSLGTAPHGVASSNKIQAATKLNAMQNSTLASALKKSKHFTHRHSGTMQFQQGFYF